MINCPPTHLTSPSNPTLVPFWPRESNPKSLVFSISRNPSRVRSFPFPRGLRLHLCAGQFNGAPMASATEGEEEDDGDLCPVDCVTEFKTEEEFQKILDKAKKTGSLVVVDFYRTSCGSCKYIEQGFAKLCRGSGDQEAGVVFLKHNVIDEYDEQSEVAERLRIKVVPLFHFYKYGALLEAFATRDKEKILATISKYTSPEKILRQLYMEVNAQVAAPLSTGLLRLYSELKAS